MVQSVAILHSLYTPHIVGGAEISTQILAETLAGELDVRVFTVGPQPKEDGVLSETINNVQVQRLPAHNLFWYGDRTVKRSAASRIAWRILDAYNVNQYKKLKQAFIENRPSVVHTQNLPGLSLSAWRAAYELGIPIVHTLRDYSLLEPVNIKMYSYFYKFLSAHYSKYVSAVVGITRFVLDKHLEQGLFPNAKTYVVSNVVEADEADRNRMKPDASRKEMVLSYFGQLNANKGIEFLIEAVKQLPTEVVSKLYICGEGELMDSLKAVASGDARIEFTGKLKKEQVKEKMFESDLTLVPSVWDEPFGRVIIESYQMGTPVYASRVGGIPDVVLNPDEYCFKPRDSEAIRSSILSYFNKSLEERSAIQRDCRSHSLRFNVEAHRENYLRIYSSLLQSNL